jgi:hypothetical protein
MGQALDMGIGLRRRGVVQQKRGAIATRQILFEGENLPPIAQSRVGEET